MKTVRVRIMSAKGHEEVQVGVEEAIQLCSTQMTTGNKWARLINEDGTTEIQTDVTFFSGDIRETIARLESVSEIWMIAALRGGSPLRRGTKAWAKASAASQKGWETRRRRAAAANMSHRREEAFCKAPCSNAKRDYLTSSTFSTLRKPAQVNVGQNTGSCASSNSNRQITYKLNFSTKTTDPVIAVKPNTITVNLLYGKAMIVEALHALCLAIEGPIHKLVQGTLSVGM